MPTSPPPRDQDTGRLSAHTLAYPAARFLTRGRAEELTAQFLGVLHDLLIRFAALDHERALLAKVMVLAQRAPERSEERLRAAVVGLAEAAARLGGGLR
jgi:hypothetical protein